MKSLLEKIIDRGVREYCTRQGVAPPQVPESGLVSSRDPGHGDFATNIAFRLNQSVRKSPKLVAEELAVLFEKLGQEIDPSCIRRIEVAGPGFINFYLAESSLAKGLLQVLEQNERFGQSPYGRGKKVLLEFVSANPTGPLTIAHGRQAAIGDSLGRILRVTGHEVTTEYYLNDAGRQMNLLGESLWAHYSEKHGKRHPFPEDGYRGEYLVALSDNLIREKKDSLFSLPKEKAVAVCREYGQKFLLEGIRRDLDDFRVRFDHYFSESSLYRSGEVDRAFEELKSKGYLFESEGALWFRATALGDDKDRVVRKSTGETTYLAPDIAYHRNKFARGFNLLVNLWGPDHHGYVARLKAACQALGHDASTVQIRIVQLTTLYRQGKPVRMSTRAGEFVTLRELMDEVGCDATRFFFIMRRVESPLDFDLDLAKEKSQENPVYYLQYAYARIAGLIQFAKREIRRDAVLDRLKEKEEMDLIRVIAEYPAILVRASEALEPYRVADYLRELATCFHKFYTFHRVVTEDGDLTDARMLLTEATRIVLRNGLQILGISQPERM